MYSGTTFRTKSGRALGAHQRIDRIARRHLTTVLPKRAYFPAIGEILKFEGRDGPDGIKRKSPAVDEPWHYIDPTSHDDKALVSFIEDHMKNLEKALYKRDKIRAAFEAAWLAHAIVDGLTPAHHYPLEEKLEELRGGEGLETRTSFKKKLLMPGVSKRHMLRNNWEFWGAKGVMTTHLMFELGFATTLASLKLNNAAPSHDELIRAGRSGVLSVFVAAARHIHSLKMYELFHKKGWNRSLATLSRKELAPTMVKTVTLAWYVAAIRAEKRRKGERV